MYTHRKDWQSKNASHPGAGIRPGGLRLLLSLGRCFCLSPGSASIPASHTPWGATDGSSSNWVLDTRPGDLDWIPGS